MNIELLSVYDDELLSLAKLREQGLKSFGWPFNFKSRDKKIIDFIHSVTNIMVFVQDSITGDKMGHYKHLSTKEREIILCGITKGLSLSKIAKELGRNRSTISREIRRNAEEKFYSPSTAQRFYSNRRRNCCPRKKLSYQAVYSLVKDKFLCQQWSPQQISERIRIEKPEYFVSFNTIYRGIYSGMFDAKNLSHGEKGAKRHL